MVFNISPSQQLIPGLTMANSRCRLLHMATPSRDAESSCTRQTLGRRTVTKYLSGLEAETKTFIRSLLTDSNVDNYISHIRRYSGGLVLSIVYGYNVKPNDDKYLLLAEECIHLLANDMAGSGLWPVVLPFLLYSPSWFLGGSFKKKAMETQVYK